MSTWTDTPYATPLTLSAATVCITGGATGIGLGFVKHFLQAGSTVIVAGRKQDALNAAKALYPAIHTVRADVRTAESRRQLYDEVVRRFPAVNVLFNNAGVLYPSDVQGRFNGQLVRASDANDDWSARQEEIDINIGGSVHLTSLFLPRFLTLKEAAVVFNTSYFAYAPSVISPTYSASKAFMHSYAITARESLRDTAVQVYEVSPPLVKTAMTSNSGEEVDDFTSSVFRRLAAGEKEVGYKLSEELRVASKEQLQAAFVRITAEGSAFGLFKPQVALKAAQ